MNLRCAALLILLGLQPLAWGGEPRSEDPPAGGERHLRTALFSGVRRAADPEGQFWLLPISLGDPSRLADADPVKPYAQRFYSLARAWVDLTGWPDGVPSDPAFAAAFDRARGEAIQAGVLGRTVLEGRAIVYAILEKHGIYDRLADEARARGSADFVGPVPDTARDDPAWLRSTPFVVGAAARGNVPAECASTFHLCSGRLVVTEMHDGCASSHKRRLASDPGYARRFADVTRPFVRQAASLDSSTDPTYWEKAARVTLAYQEALRDAGILAEIARSRPDGVHTRSAVEERSSRDSAPLRNAP